MTNEPLIALSPCPWCGETRVRQLSRNFWGCPDCNTWISRAWKNDPLGVFFPPGGYSNNPKVVAILKENYIKHGLRVDRDNEV